MEANTAATAATSAERSPYLDYQGASEYCKLHRSTIWRAVRAGVLEASGPGSAIRFRRDELDRWMTSRNRKQ